MTNFCHPVLAPSLSLCSSFWSLSPSVCVCIIMKLRFSLYKSPISGYSFLSLPYFSLFGIRNVMLEVMLETTDKPPPHFLNGWSSHTFLPQSMCSSRSSLLQLDYGFLLHYALIIILQGRDCSCTEVVLKNLKLFLIRIFCFLSLQAMYFTRKCRADQNIRFHH